jgi:predicted nucleic acid-binding Zn ribbon protein
MKFRIRDKRKNGINSFENILPDIIHEFELEKSFTIEELVAQWYSIVGDIISTHSKPDRIYKNILFVTVDHSVYANEIVMMKDMLLKNLHEQFFFHAIRDIKVEIKAIRW